MQAQKAFTVDEAATYTGLSRNYIYKLIHLKKIPCYKPLNGKVYFKPDELEEFLYRNRQAADYEGSRK